LKFIFKKLLNSQHYLFFTNISPLTLAEALIVMLLRKMTMRIKDRVKESGPGKTQF